MARGNNTNRPPPDYTSFGSSSSMDELSSPYYLQNGDHPGLILVSHSLTGSNFSSWHRALLLALTAKNKLVFIDGTIVRPPSTDLLFSSWNRCNSMVISWILNSVANDIADNLLYFSTGYKVWNDLKTRYSQANGPRIFQLKQRISSLCQGSLDVNGYYSKLKSLWDELQDYILLPSCTCGALREIGASKEQDHILLLEPLSSLTKVFSMVLQEERQRQLSVALPTPAAPDTPILTSVASSPPSISTAVAVQRRL
ncbi:uncharacterized protein LOC133293976 [Gastrolobium bilobum]|uniref:uncharacterized protein LOC133293976 n=1 Tax=Gastrolobium bilobum TaxID=150636 RepID=UPI002AB1EB30|nr:uncharacterized protein LOC133293976 [Gastrolobium bilobum]